MSIFLRLGRREGEEGNTSDYTEPTLVELKTLTRKWPVSPLSVALALSLFRQTDNYLAPADRRDPPGEWPRGVGLERVGAEIVEVLVPVPSGMYVVVLLPPWTVLYARPGERAELDWLTLVLLMTVQ